MTKSRKRRKQSQNAYFEEPVSIPGPSHSTKVDIQAVGYSLSKDGRRVIATAAPIDTLANKTTTRRTSSTSRPKLRPFNIQNPVSSNPLPKFSFSEYTLGEHFSAYVQDDSSNYFDLDEEMEDNPSEPNEKDRPGAGSKRKRGPSVCVFPHVF